MIITSSPLNNKLVGGIPTPSEKYDFVSWGYYSQKSQNMENNPNVPNHQTSI